MGYCMHLPLTILGRKYNVIVGLSQSMPEDLQGEHYVEGE